MDFPAAISGRILLVGPAEAARELETILITDSWESTRAQTPAQALRRVRSDAALDLVILTPEGSLHLFTELCRDIKLDNRTAFVSVIFVLPPGHPESRAEVFEAGADDYLQLPASPREILLRLSNALRIKRATDSLEAATAVISSLANAIEGRDAYTHGHVERVSTYSVEIGRRASVDSVGLAALKVGGIVHDIGKVLIPDQILNKPGRLDDVEMEIVKRHPVIGYDILQPLRTFRNVLPIVRWHHERPNGTGYPDGLKGDQLPLLPRIVAVADCFDALSTARPYRSPCSPSKCREILSTQAENDNLDPSLVAVLFDLLDENVPTPAFAPSGSVATAL